MPQNALVGWRFAWPKWLTNAGRLSPFQAANVAYVDETVAKAIAATPKADADIDFLKVEVDILRGRLSMLEADLKRLRNEAGFA
jgi:hypothetical protein